MKFSFQHIIDDWNLLFRPHKGASRENILNRQAAKRLRKQLRRQVKDMLVVLLGVISAGFGLKSFLLPNDFVDGGVMGISLLTQSQTQLPLSLLIIVFNIPFLILGYHQVSRNFSIKSTIAILLLAIAVALIPYPKLTDDKLLVAVFGGFFLGLGIGLAIRGGSVIDGTEVLAIYMSRKNSLTVGDFILIFNILIFSVAAYLLSPTVAMYSVLTYLSASKTVDFILEGIEEYTGVTIISSKSQQVSQMIKTKLGRGLTIYTGRKGFGRSGESDQEIDIIFTVITRLEVNRFTTEVERIDPRAFIVMHSIRDTRGGMVRKIPLKEK